MNYVPWKLADSFIVQLTLLFRKSNTSTIIYMIFYYYQPIKIHLDIPKFKWHHVSIKNIYFRLIGIIYCFYHLTFSPALERTSAVVVCKYPLAHISSSQHFFRFINKKLRDIKSRLRQSSQPGLRHVFLIGRLHFTLYCRGAFISCCYLVFVGFSLFRGSLDSCWVQAMKKKGTVRVCVEFLLVVFEFERMNCVIAFVGKCFVV